MGTKIGQPESHETKSVWRTSIFPYVEHRDTVQQKTTEKHAQSGSAITCYLSPAIQGHRTTQRYPLPSNDSELVRREHAWGLLKLMLHHAT